MSTRPTTPKINLLPYRAERKKEIAKRFNIFLGASAGAALAVMALVHVGHTMIKSNQEARNAYIEGQNQLLDKEIAEIARLKDDIAAMISRKQVVEGLQANRPRIVMLLNYIAKPPEGVFYREISQKGDVVTFKGHAVSNTAVSTLIREIESSGVLSEPRLIETKKSTAGGRNGIVMMEFGISAKLINLSALAAAQKNADAKSKANQAVKDALEQTAKAGAELPDVELSVQDPSQPSSQPQPSAQPAEPEAQQATSAAPQAPAPAPAPAAPSETTPTTAPQQ